MNDSPASNATSRDVLAIWNPGAAANWSLLFTPVFGAWLHEQNWHALGQTEQAATARRWLLTSLAVILCMVGARWLLPATDAVDTALKGLALGYLILWYFVAAKPQARYVEERFGKNYPRRGWGKPLLVATAVLVLWWLTIAVVAGLVQGSAAGG